MTRFRIAATSWLLMSLAALAQAQDPTYNAATDWATTYPTTASIQAATQNTWVPVMCGVPAK